MKPQADDSRNAVCLSFLEPLSLYSTATQNHSRLVLALAWPHFCVTSHVGIFCVVWRKFFALPNAKPQRKSVEYRLRWVPNGNFNLCVGHVYFMFFVLISFTYGGQHKPNVQWNMGLSPPRHMEIISILFRLYYFPPFVPFSFCYCRWKTLITVQSVLTNICDFQIGNLCPTSVVYWDGLSEMADTIPCSTTKESNMTKPSLLHREHNQKRSYWEIVSGESYEYECSKAIILTKGQRATASMLAKGSIVALLYWRKCV